MQSERDQVFAELRADSEEAMRLHSRAVAHARQLLSRDPRGVTAPVSIPRAPETDPGAARPRLTPAGPPSTPPEAEEVVAVDS